LIRALGEETGNPIMAFHRPSFFPSIERAPHHIYITELGGQVSSGRDTFMSKCSCVAPVLSYSSFARALLEALLPLVQ
jgi:hypothetical protein